MRSLGKVFWILVVLVFAAATASPKPKPAAEDGSGTIVIVFKDGSQRSFRLADIARIEFDSSAGTAAAAGRARFLGQWKVGDGTGRTFSIILKPDGVARKSIGSNEKGSWTVVNGEARITWDDGWHDVLRKVGNKYQKVAFAPGSAFTDQPANVTDAEYTEPK
jgi:hypothetical protein